MSTTLPDQRSIHTTLGDEPYWLMCRTEDDDGGGFWAVLGINDPCEGGGEARAFQQVAAPLTTRCELIPNDEAAFVAWSKRAGMRR